MIKSAVNLMSDLRLRSAKSDGKSRQFCTPWPKMWVWNMPFVSVLRSLRWSSRALGSAEELFPSTKDEQELEVSLTKTLLVQVLNRTQTNERSEVSFHFAVPFRFCLCSATVLFPTNVFSLGTFSSHSFWHLETASLHFPRLFLITWVFSKQKQKVCFKLTF